MVQSVNNSNNNTALYAAMAGGTIGAVAGHATKSILKDGNYTDEFIHQVNKNLVNSDEGKLIKDICSLDKNSATYLDDCVNTMKKHAAVLGINPNEVSKTDVDFFKMCGGKEKFTQYFDEQVSKLSKKIGEEIKLGKDTNVLDIMKKHIPEDLDEVFDRTKNAFKSGIDEESNTIIKYAKSAQRNLKLKAAGIYGAIGAAALGLTTLLCAGKKGPQ